MNNEKPRQSPRFICFYELKPYSVLCGEENLTTEFTGNTEDLYLVDGNRNKESLKFQTLNKIKHSIC